MDNKLRISYSLLLMWEQGLVDDCVRYYFKLPTEKKAWQTTGIDWHEKWEKYILKNKKLPEEFGGGGLKNPQCEIKMEIQGSEFGKEYDWLEMVGVLDCLDEPTIHEFKSGKSPIGRYESSYQTVMYALMAEKRGHEVDRGIIHHYDGVAKEYETSMIWLTQKRKDDTLDKILTAGFEIKTYFDKENLWRLKEAK